LLSRQRYGLILPYSARFLLQKWSQRLPESGFGIDSLSELFSFASLLMTNKYSLYMKLRITRWLVSALALFISFNVQAQTAPDPVLFTVNGQPVTKEEFLYVYKKNNPDKQNDYSKESLEEYLDLYINFKLKVTEARAEKIDTTEKVREELQKYGDQLIKSNFDKEVLEQAAQKMYAQMQAERLVYHIMLTPDPKEMGKDSTMLMAKLEEIRQRALKGEDFGKLAKEFSVDKSFPDNPGMIGWVIAGQINDKAVEDGIFQTPIGGISPVIRSKYGYHVLRIATERPSQGTVTVSHILIKTPKDATPADIAKGKAKIDSIAALIKSDAATFEEMAAKFSEDKGTAGKEGRLEPFTTGKMTHNFQEAAFALKNVGDISAPIQTSYGWHLIRLIDKQPLGSYADMKDDLKGRIERSPEYAVLRQEFIQKAKTAYGFTEFADAKKEMLGILDSGFVKNTWSMHQAKGMEKPVFTIGTRAYSQLELASYLDINQRITRDKNIEEKYNKLYNQAVEQTIIEYDLSQRNVDFRRLLQEYRDGLPLFAMLERKIWSRGSTDTAGLRSYYDVHKTEYMWDERLDATTYTCKDAKTAKSVRKLAGKKTSDKDILTKFNKDSVILVSVRSGLYMPGQDSNIDKLNKQPGIGEDILNADGSITFVRLNKIVPPTPKTLEEARGYVISAYQDQLEKEWISELHNKYPVVINKEVFNSMIR